MYVQILQNYLENEKKIFSEQNLVYVLPNTV